MSNFLEENNLTGVGYAEPYAGGAGLALRLLFEGYVKHIYINDLDPSINAFWKTILEHPNKFCKWLLEVDITLENWHFYKEIQKKSNTVDTFELAKSTFFLNRTNISGVIKGGPIGGYTQKSKYKIDARFNKEKLIERIHRIANMKTHITVSNDDGIEFIKKMNRKRNKIFIYIDPPYFKKGACLYMNYFEKKDHEFLSQKIKNIKHDWLISYDNNEFIIDLYSDKFKIIYELSQCASNRIGNEVIILPDNLKIENSISFLKKPITVEAIK